MTFKLKQSLLTYLLMLFSCLSIAEQTYKFIKSEKVSGGTQLTKAFGLLPKSSQIKFTLPEYSGKISYFENNIVFPTVASELSTSFGVYQTERALPTYKFEFIISDPKTIDLKLSDLLFTDPTSAFDDLITVSKPYDFQGLKAVTVSISPFRLQNGKLATCKSLTLKFRNNQDSKVYPWMHPDFTTIAKQTFINFDAGKVNPEIKPTKLLIITSAEINNSSVLEPFRKWKNKNGIQTETHLYPSETGEGVEALKDFIGKQKDFTHLLLCGSPEDIPAQAFYSLNSTWFKSPNWEFIPLPKKEKLNKGVTSDQYYAGVDPTIGNYIPNLFVSRIPLSKPADVRRMLNRIMNYKLTTKKKRHTLAIASAENNGRNLPDQALIEQLAKRYNEVEFKTLFAADKKLSEKVINNALNEQPTLTIYLGHGFIDRWQTSGYRALNETKPTIFFQPVCQTGALFTKSMAAQQCKVNAIGVFAASNNCYTSVSSKLTQLTMEA
ncbi:MAG: hypothetical protein KAG98_04850, partial [Lentisphaeria bacterium]|nr:hypothetical protein [Lentisphaeria bacterium]